jgi:hypothetical protein
MNEPLPYRVAEEPQFEAFASIPRLFREVVVSEKIDGTNAQITILPDDRVLAGSRSRFITCEDDNFGFAKWVKKNEDELRKGLGYGIHYGEWFGSGIQRGYGLTNGEKRFALFNAARWTDDVRPKCCHVVPVLWTGILCSTTIKEIADKLLADGSVAVPGFTKPEGIVVYHTKSRQLYKYTFDKNDGHKSL